MRDNPTPHPTRQAIVRWTSAVLIVVMAYPLSVGPVLALALKGILPYGCVLTFYHPLFLLVHQSDVLLGWLMWYYEFWFYFLGV